MWLHEDNKIFKSSDESRFLLLFPCRYSLLLERGQIDPQLNEHISEEARRFSVSHTVQNVNSVLCCRKTELKPGLFFFLMSLQIQYDLLLSCECVHLCV